MTSYLIAKILLSFVAVAQALGPVRADFNKTHATNPLWTPHARFHVVWQVLLQAGVSVVALLLLWAFPSSLHTWIAAALVFNWLVTFVLTILFMPAYRGSLADENGIAPFRFNLPGRSLEVDTNVFGAVVLGILGTVAVGLLVVS